MFTVIILPLSVGLRLCWLGRLVAVILRFFELAAAFSETHYFLKSLSLRVIILEKGATVTVAAFCLSLDLIMFGTHYFWDSLFFESLSP
jgi:hypothetical protein